MLLFIDSYDNFTYNIVQYFAELNQNVEARRNDDIISEVIAALKPRYLVISPGPYTPKEVGVSITAMQHLADKLSVIGVCSGHQAIGEVFGGDIMRAQTLIHGKVSPVFHRGRGMLGNLPDPIICTRYHSFVIGRTTLPECFEITSWTENNETMGVRRKNYVVEDVQFYPETLLTEYGHDMLRNFLEEFKDSKAA